MIMLSASACSLGGGADSSTDGDFDRVESDSMHNDGDIDNPEADGYENENGESAIPDGDADSTDIPGEIETDESVTDGDSESAENIEDENTDIDDEFDSIDGDTTEADDDAETQLEEEVEPDEESLSNPDEYIARALMAGEMSPTQAFKSISWSNGWPVWTSQGTWIFCHWYNNGTWGLAGDFNDWTPLAMIRVNDYLCVETSVADPVGSKYKYVGTKTQYLADPWARHYNYDQNGRISYVRPPDQGAHLEYYVGLEEEGLLPRNVRVYVPEGDGPWPVLYMHDGQNLFDPDAIMGGWKMQDAVAGIAASLLIVGIDNTTERMSEYTHVDDQIDDLGNINAKGDDYAVLVNDHLRPYIESRYPVSDLRGIMGSSLGGLISLYIAHLYPEDYDFAGSLSGSLYWGKAGLTNLTMEELYEAAGKRDFAIYVDSGGSDGGDGCTDPNGDGLPADDPNDSDSYCATRHFADAMADLGYDWNTELWHWYEAEAEHNEIAWAVRVFRPLEIFLSLDD